MYDAVIVGAGPGGSAAATFMARAGLRVLLLDKSGRIDLSKATETLAAEVLT